MTNVVDPIADFLSRLRNAQQRNYEVVSIPASNLKESIAEVLQKYGYVKSVERRADEPQDKLDIELRYDEDDEPIIESMERVSKPSRRVYAGSDNIPDVLNGLGVAVVSTSSGVMAGRDAEAAGVGGEVMFSIY